MKRFFYITIALFAILLSGCEIKQDREDCDNAYVFFSYYGDGDKQIFSEKIGKVNMFVYDGKGQIADIRTLDNIGLTDKPVVKLALPTGHYDIVCWGNAIDFTDLKGTDNINSGKAAAKYTGNIDNTIHSADSLYIGRKKIRVIQDKLTRDTVEFAGAHVNIIVKMSGFSDGAQPTDDPLVRARVKAHSSLGFGNNYTGEYAVCDPECKTIVDNEMFYLSRLKVLRFEDNNNVDIELYEAASGIAVTSLGLKDFMRDNDISISGKHEVTIGIHFVKTGMGVNIKPWESSNIKPEW